jgi:hypothetical protein
MNVSGTIDSAFASFRRDMQKIATFPICPLWPISLIGPWVNRRVPIKVIFNGNFKGGAPGGLFAVDRKQDSGRSKGVSR